MENRRGESLSDQNRHYGLGFDLPAGLRKFDPDQPRDERGRWTSGGGGSSLSYAGDADAAARTSAAIAVGVAATEGTILGPLSAAAEEALASVAASVAAGVAGAAAAMGLIFIPSPNDSVVSSGAVPGEAGLNYSINHDEGSLRITRMGAAGEEVVATAHLGADGRFLDETGAPIARAAGGSVVVDPDAIRAAAKAKDGVADGARAGAEAQTEESREEPKLCPAQGPESIKGRKLFDVQYQQFVRDLVNPQRRPQLPPELTFGLHDPVTGELVKFDDCRESDGAMIEAKGHYEEMMRPDWAQGSEILADKWTKQARRQVEASGERPVEWYFHEEAAAKFAREVFKDSVLSRQIRIIVAPHPAGVPNPNPRIK